jgi:hypothetical protein
MEKMEYLEENPKTAQSFTPFSEAEMQSLRDRAKPYAGDGRFELYKTSIKFDNPETRYAHDFPQDMQSIEMRQIAKAAANTGNPFPEVKDPAKSPWPQTMDF